MSVLALAVITAFAASSPLAAITIGQVDDFQDGTTQNWFGASPQNISNSGPNGAGDNALRAMASGSPFGAHGKLLVYNNGAAWLGNWTSVGVVQVALDVRNPNTFPLAMRLAIAGPDGFSGGGGGDVHVTTDAISVAADDAWHSVTFDVLADDFTSLNPPYIDVGVALAGVTHLRILHNAEASFLGEVIDGDFYVDNIRAIGAPAMLAGDYNGNDTVDAADYVVWRKSNGQSGAVLAADGTGPSGVPDGVVDNLDYSFWRARFGETQAGGSHQHGAGAVVAVVPEPATISFSGAGMLALAAALRRIARGKQPAS